LLAPAARTLLSHRLELAGAARGTRRANLYRSRLFRLAAAGAARSHLDPPSSAATGSPLATIAPAHLPGGHSGVPAFSLAGTLGLSGAAPLSGGSADPFRMAAALL